MALLGCRRGNASSEWGKVEEWAPFVARYGLTGTEDKLRMPAFENHAIAAIFHGHHHATDHCTWRGIEVFKPGAVKNDAHPFAVVRVTDQRMTVASYDWDRDAWSSASFDHAPALTASQSVESAPASR